MVKPLDIAQASSKEELSRLLVKLRLRSDFKANAKGITESIVDGFSVDEIEALPESTLVHIADSYFIMSRKGVSDQDIFNKIELQRSLLGEDKPVPENMNLSKYIKLRFKSDFPQMALVDEMVINVEILYAVTWFSRDLKSKYTWESANTYASKVFAVMKKRFEDSQAVPVVSEPASEKEYEVVVEEVIEDEVEEVNESPVNKWVLYILIIAVLGGLLGYWLLYMDGLVYIQKYLS